MERCCVLSARRYEFTDDKGKSVEGVKISYLTGDVSTTGDVRGVEPLSISGPLELWNQVLDLPAMYDVDFKQRPGRNGKPVLQVVGLKFLNQVKISGVSQAGG